jgi:hypothetical protein
MSAEPAEYATDEVDDRFAAMCRRGEILNGLIQKHIISTSEALADFEVFYLDWRRRSRDDFRLSERAGCRASFLYFTRKASPR